MSSDEWSQSPAGLGAAAVKQRRASIHHSGAIRTPTDGLRARRYVGGAGDRGDLDCWVYGRSHGLLLKIRTGGPGPEMAGEPTSGP